MAMKTLRETARALVAPGKGILAPLATWRGDPMRVDDGQRAFHHRARCNSSARLGAHTAELERSVE